MTWTPMDAMFLYGETPETMMHVGGLLPMTLPPDAPADFLREQGLVARCARTAHARRYSSYAGEVAPATCARRASPSRARVREFTHTTSISRSSTAV